jgi:subtilisin-like proprotein convertase family protein
VVWLLIVEVAGAGAPPMALQGERARLGLSVSDIADVVATDRYVDRDTGVTHLYLRQRLRGLDVIDGTMTLTLARDGSVAHVGDRFVRGLAGKAPRGVTPGQTAGEARSAAARSLKAGRVAGGSPAPRLVYARGDAGDLRLAWNLQIEPVDGKHRWDAVVDAQNLALLGAADWVAHAESYNVFAPPLASPLEGVRTLVSDPADPLASPYGWHDTDGAPGAESTLTIGNNVRAGTDFDDDDRRSPDPGTEADGGSDLLFDFPLDLTQQPEQYRAAAVTNMFFWTNHIHDVTYHHGFTEAAGNFQENNYGRGGIDGDSVMAANGPPASGSTGQFITPPDGERPTLRLGTLLSPIVSQPNRDASLDHFIIAHEYMHGISHRLTGGPSAGSCLFGSGETSGGGEGWSDWLGLVLTANAAQTATTPRGGWDYAAFGNATAYTTDMSANPRTYNTIKVDREVHAVGRVWASMLWEMYWNLVHKYGFNPNLRDGWASGGNNLALRLVLDGLKLQACNPGFVDARDAILAADNLLTGGANQCPIWRAFAKRGLGQNASQGRADSIADGTESFDVPSTACGPGPVNVTVAERGDGDGVEPGEAIAVTGSFRNSGDLDVDSLSLALSGAGLSVFRSPTAFPDLPAGASAQNPEPLLAKIPASAQCGTIASAALALAGSHGTTEVPVRIELGSPRAKTDASSSDVPITIPDGSSSGVNSTVTIAGLPGPLRDLDVAIASINHSFVSDLVITLTSPAGTTVTLVDRNGGSRLESFPGPSDFLDTVFDDDATTPILPTTPDDAPFTGRFRPVQPLSAFDGEDGNGTWTLNIADLEEPDAGTLNAWGLTLAPVVCSADPTPPTIGVTSSPASPQIGQPVQFRSSSTDNGPIERQRWDLDNDGEFDDATGTNATHTFDTAGAHTVRLEVVDDRLDTYVHSTTITVGYRLLGFFSPLPKSDWKAGAAIPVKLALADTNGTRISDTQAQAIVANCDAKITFTAGTPPSNCFAYDTLTDTFQFNLNTPKTLTGNHTITATITNAGSVVNTNWVQITIKR